MRGFGEHIVGMEAKRNMAFSVLRGHDIFEVNLDLVLGIVGMVDFIHGGGFFVSQKRTMVGCAHYDETLMH